MAAHQAQHLAERDIIVLQKLPGILFRRAPVHSTASRFHSHDGKIEQVVAVSQSRSPFSTAATIRSRRFQGGRAISASRQCERGQAHVLMCSVRVHHAHFYIAV